ncbi:MAG: VCBS repeat-containing protein [Pyrinomonadaceae bacterium]
MKLRILTIIISLVLAIFGLWQLRANASAQGQDLAASSVTAVSTFSNPSAIIGVDRLAGGQPGKANPYPSNIVVAGLTGTVSKVTVTLNQINHTFPDDLDVLLVGPVGQMAMIMSDVGGGRDLINTTLTLDQAAVTLMPNDTMIDPGTYHPTNLPGEPSLEPDGWERMTSPGPGNQLYPSDLSVFNGTAPNGTWQLYVVDDENGDTGNITGGWSISITTGPAAIAGKSFDFDGDGKADISTFRGSAGDWYRLDSSNGAFVAQHFGATGDRPVPADYDSDGKTDIAIYRPSSGTWYIMNSATNTVAGVAFGNSTDLPVPADYDGDRKADVAVYRPSAGGWYRLNSTDGAFVSTAFGLSTDQPAPADFDGDGKTDLCVYRGSSGDWYRLNSTTGQFVAQHFGANGDQATQADYDGDGKADTSIFRPASGDWYRLDSSTGAFVAYHFGANGDKPVAADFDGDGKTDIAVYRPTGSTWYIQRSTNGFQATAFGASADIPSPNSFVY